MFRKITILRLAENNSLLNFNLDWPARLWKRNEARGNIALLQYAGILEGNISRRLMDHDGLSGFKTVMVPIHHHIQHASIKWVMDISDKQQEALDKLVHVVFPQAISSPSKQWWYLKERVSDRDLADDYLINTHSSIATSLQELEMMLYAHPVNQSRKRYQQSSITGFMLGNIGKKSWKKHRKVVGNSKLVSMLCEQQSLHSWLERPYANCTLIMGKESGDQELFQIKEMVLHMMESGRCDFVEVVQSSRHDFYSASWFYDAYSRCRHYFLKQTI